MGVNNIPEVGVADMHLCIMQYQVWLVGMTDQKARFLASVILI